ncbi:putative light-harvesting complex-like protein OHP2 [Helianthus anomalus]
MKSILMRVLFCKIHCSFICFCKSSTASHLYNSGPLKLENSPQAPHSSVVTDTSDQNHVEDVKENEISEDEKKESQIEIVVVRSCMKKKDDSLLGEVGGGWWGWRRHVGGGG